MNKILVSFFPLFFFMILFIGIDSHAQELAPGFDACIEKAETTGQENVCYGRAIKYWAPKLEKAYAEARNQCKQNVNPQRCLTKLKSMQINWLAYQEKMIELLKGEPIFEDAPALMPLQEALRFEPESTKYQCEMLLAIP